MTSLYLRRATLMSIVFFVSSLGAQQTAAARRTGRTTCAPPPVAAAGDLAQSTAKDDADIPSRGTQTPTSIRFVNGTCSTVSVIWIDYYGGRKVYRRLPPGGSYEQETFDGNTWAIETSEPTRRLGYFTTGLTASRAVIRELVAAGARR
jgi:hypothetical protein